MEQAPKLHVITIATEANRHLERLQASATAHNIDLNILGLGERYEKHGKKISFVRQFLNALSENDIVLYVDAYDVIFLSDTEKILNQFLNFKTQILFAAEYNFGFHPDYNPFKKHLTYLNYPKSNTLYRFLNAGTFIGYRDALVSLFDQLNLSENDYCDQGIFSTAFSKKPSLLTLDYNQKIFSCNGGRGSLEDKDYCIKDRKLFAIQTQNYPCILHIPGKLFQPLDQISNALNYTHYKGAYSSEEIQYYMNAKKAYSKANYFKLDPFLYFFLEKTLIYAILVILILVCTYYFFS